MYPLIDFSALRLVELAPARLEQMVNLRVTIPDEVEFALARPGGMPYIVTIRIARQEPSHKDRLETPLLYEFAYHGAPFKRPYLHPYPDVFKIFLDHLRRA